MATYTQSSIGSFTISSDGEIDLTNGNGVNSNSSDYITLYATVTFTKSGTAILKCAAVTYSTVRVDADIAKSSVSFKPSTGWPDEYVARGHNSVGMQAGDIVSATVAAGQTYKFYFRVYNSGTVTLLPRINFAESGSGNWTKEDIYIGSVTDEYNRTIQSAERYELYCFEFKTSQSGGFVELTGGTADSLAWLTENNSSYVFDRTTGLIDETYEKGYTYYPGGSSIQINTADTLYLWVRVNKVDSGSISFRIYPPGSSGSPWGVDRLKTATEVTIAGVSWSIPSDYTKTKMLEYIELTFASAGTYKFKAEGSEQLYGYLTSSLDIDDSSGVPLSSVTLASSNGTSSGFEFSYDFSNSQISSGQTYYLMLRTPSGNTNVNSFIISITSEDGHYSYILQSDQIDIVMTHERSYTLTTTASSCNGIYFRAKFGRAGPVTVEITSTDKSLIYVTNVYYGWNTNTGAPYKDSGQSEAAGGSTQSFTANTVDDYYIWVRGIQDKSSTSIVLRISLSDPEWRYDQYTAITSIDSVTTTPIYSISRKLGVRVMVSFRSNGEVSFELNANSGATMYITPYTSQSSDGTYGFDSLGDGLPYINFSYDKASGGRTKAITVDSSSKYWIWIQPLTESSYGDASVTITPSNIAWKPVNRGDITNPTETREIQTISSPAEAYYSNIQFAESGTAEFYSDESLGFDLVAWLAEKTSSIDGETGVPGGTIYARDDNGGIVQFTYEVTAGTEYRLWWRASKKTDSGTIYVYVKPPSASPISTSVGLWIYDGSEWKKVAIFYGDDNYQWQQVTKEYVGIGDDNMPAEWIDY